MSATRGSLRGPFRPKRRNAAHPYAGQQIRERRPVDPRAHWARDERRV